MKDAVFIEGTRSGYGPDQCKGTMTVGELIEYLEQFDYGTEVFIRNDNGYTYGSVTGRNLFSGSYDGDSVVIDG